MIILKDGYRYTDGMGHEISEEIYRRFGGHMSRTEIGHVATTEEFIATFIADLRIPHYDHIKVINTGYPNGVTASVIKGAGYSHYSQLHYVSPQYVDWSRWQMIPTKLKPDEIRFRYFLTDPVRGADSRFGNTIIQLPDNVNGKRIPEFKDKIVSAMMYRVSLHHNWRVHPISMNSLLNRPVANHLYAKA